MRIFGGRFEQFMWDLWRKYKSRFRAIAVAGLAVTGLLIGTALPARAAQNASVGLFMHLLNPPDSITDLSASAVGVQNGDVQLVWTTPSNENGVAMSHYYVRFATYPASSQAQAEAWWTSLTSSERIVSPAHAAGVTEFSVISGLTVGVTHYFGIKVVDNDGQVSSIDTRAGTAQQASSLPVQSFSPPSTPPFLTGVAQSTGSINWQWGAAAGASFYTLNEYPSGSMVVQTSQLQYTESGLSPNEAVARTVRAASIYGLSSPTSATTVYTLAATPSSLALINRGTGSIDIGWSANGNATGTLYRVERSDDGINFAPLPFVSTPALTDTGLLTLTTYYYRVRAINGDGIQTALSSTLSVYIPPDTMAPRQPMGFRGSLDTSGTTFTIIWDPVTLNDDGTPLTDLAGYHVYRRTSLTGTPVRLTTAPISVPAYADTVNGQTYYYTARSVDLLGNESSDSLYVDSSLAANVIFLASDGLSNVIVPRSISDLMRSSFNKYLVPLTIRMIEEPAVVDGTIVRSVRLQLIRGDTLEAVEDLSFPLALARVAVGYNLQNGEVATGSPLSAAAATLSGVTPSQLSLYWSNGISWIKLGGSLNLSEQTLSVYTAFLGNYQLRTESRSPVLSLSGANVYPRVFTPNGDGLNDRVYFVLENPNDAAVRGEIIDKEGRFITTLPDPTTIGGVGTTMIWDGRDANGNVVPGGAYMYRIEGEGQTFTGTVGVAR